MKTPGVYIIEKDAFPNSVVEVATAVPAFIGYTEKADNGGKSLLNKPFRVTSFSDYMRFFGGGPEYKFTLASGAAGVKASTADPAKVDDLEKAAKDPKATKEDKQNAAAARAKADDAAAKTAEDTAKTDADALKTAQDAAAAEGAGDTEKKAAADAKTKADASAKAAKDARSKANASALTAANLFVDANITIEGVGFELDRDASKPIYRLYDAMKFFFQNGGGPCYIVAVGSYGDDIKKGMFDGTDDDQPGWGLPTLEKEQEPTMVLVPDALSLSSKDNCYSVYQQILAHCGKMMSRIGVFDVYDGNKDRRDPVEGDVVENFREGIGTNFMNYGTAYYPWINTSIIQDTEVSFENLTDDSLKELQGLIFKELKISPTAPTDGTVENSKVVNTRTYLNYLPTYTDAYVAQKNETPDMDTNPSPTELHKTLVVLSPAYNAILKEIQNTLNVMPPASAMAGIYTMVDNTRGVWKAPANVSLSSSISPTVNITFEDQEDLNMPLNGKAVNALRSFVGEGTLVWGARTLDGNSQDWKYINVRRTMIMLEQSIKAASKAYVFEPNDANTWTTVKSMIDNFLYQQWKKGALVGSKSTDAYAVLVGLGSTMTGDDILNGIMRITVLVAVSRPAEFIEITFQQQMQKS